MGIDQGYVCTDRRIILKIDLGETDCTDVEWI
jgi:hypothetical protein